MTSLNLHTHPECEIVPEMDHYVVLIYGRFYCSVDTYEEGVKELESYFENKK